MRDVNLLSSNGVNVEKGLELLGDMEMYDETLQDFLTEVSERIPKINDFKETSDLENYAIIVHALKSDSGYLGFTKLEELSLNHELESKSGNTDYINDNYDELMGELNRIVDVVKEYLG